jgi:hypothetical protein
LCAQGGALKFDTKIAVVLRDDLPTWQKLNVTAFTAATVDGVVGADYEDASSNLYLPMFVQPVLVFSANASQLKTAYERARGHQLRFAIFTEELFATGNDIDNRAAVKMVKDEDLKLVGMALRGEKSIMDRALNGLSLHR